MRFNLCFALMTATVALSASISNKDEGPTQDQLLQEIDNLSAQVEQLQQLQQPPSSPSTPLVPSNQQVSKSRLEDNNQARAFQKKQHHKFVKKNFLSKWGKVTWYGGGQLNAPACGGHVGDNDAVVAVKQNGGMGKCGDTIHIHRWVNGKHLFKSVRVGDYCEGCDWGHMDATQSVFRYLSGSNSLDAGVLSGNNLHFKLIEN